MLRAWNVEQGISYRSLSETLQSCLFLAFTLQSTSDWGVTAILWIPRVQRKLAKLMRVLAPRGSLLFSVPVGRARVQFNAHRIHTPEQILSYFSGLELVSFSAVDDARKFVPDADPAEFANSNYACGMFHFRRL
jgi:hypothetical protein